MLRGPRLAACSAALLLAGALAACGPEGAPRSARNVTDPTPTAGTVPDGHGGQVAAAAKDPLRKGEHRLELEMPEAYEPQAPTASGTDDYRCFLLDPELDKDTFITGVDVRPGNAKVVHHVILFEVPPDHVREAEDQDAATSGQGWTCFGGPGMGGGASGLDDAPWLGAWAPGGRESLLKPGYGTRLEKGSRIVMQVHYNLLIGDGPDVSAARLRVADTAPDGSAITPVSTMLLPAPVELPCRPAHSDNELCDREKAVADVQERFGMAGSAADLLHLLCGTQIEASQTTTCTRQIRDRATLMGSAGPSPLHVRSMW
jgi:hypothetical protein